MLGNFAMTEFLVRLKQRKLVQWAVAYIAFAFALIQVLDVVAGSYDWPHSAMHIVFGLLALGFVVMLVLAWYHGEKGRQRVSGAELLLIALVLAVGGGLLWRFGRGGSQPVVANVAAASVARASAPAGSAVSARAASASTATTASSIIAQPIPAKSIAVLAFTDLSPRHDQGYFSDGMSDEIRNALAQINDLKVAGRDSSFYFKGKDERLGVIGKTLGVADVLEGSVRKQGNAVRITAQLVRVADDTQLWSHAYDGNLSDVFKLQENIARQVTGELKLVLSASQQTQLVNAGTTNTAAYTLYLQATEVLNRRDFPHFVEAASWLRQAIKLDPDFARAHSRLALMLTLANDANPEAASQAQAALALDPSDAEAEAVLGLLASYHRRFLDAQSAMERAFALAPNDASVNLYLAEALIETGYTQQGIAHLDRALTIDPLLPNALFWRGVEYAYAGNFAAAQRTLQRADRLGLTVVNIGFQTLAEARGDHAKARALMLPFLLKDDSCLRQPAKSMPILLDGMYGGDSSARTKAMTVINECLAAKPAFVPGWVPIALLYLDQPQRALDVIALGPTDNDSAVFTVLWSPVDKPRANCRNSRHSRAGLASPRCGTNTVRPTIAARTRRAITSARDEVKMPP
jgi:TolB-like protein/Tfp pilus assembly protein PilF